ncbi:hypothetical protein C5E51_34400 [Nocardia nova]|nr:hypothetical protein C5E51_34400 [Nocardia nova]
MTVFCIAFVVGVVTGLLKYHADPNHAVPMAILSGALGAGATVGWVLLVDWTKMATFRGLAMLAVSVLLGGSAGMLAFLAVHSAATAILYAASTFAATLLGLDKITF